MALFSLSPHSRVLILFKLYHFQAFKGGYMMPNQYHPDINGPPLTLSPHLRFGCISVRYFYWAIHDIFREVGYIFSYGAMNSASVDATQAVCAHSHSFFSSDPQCQVRKESPPLAVTTQLIWREYFYIMSVRNRKYAQMTDNPICLQIPWYHNENHLEVWEMVMLLFVMLSEHVFFFFKIWLISSFTFFQGKTGYPWIDACMNQLRQEGWIHHVGRHAVSCFLTRGDLWIHWEDGLKVN